MENQTSPLPKARPAQCSAPSDSHLASHRFFSSRINPNRSRRLNTSITVTDRIAADTPASISIMPQWKDESGSERRPCETVMDVKEPRRTTHNAGRVDCCEYAGFERQPAAQPEAVCTTQTHRCVPGRPSWNASLPSVPAIESKLIPFKGLAICEERPAALRTGPAACFCSGDWR